MEEVVFLTLIISLLGLALIIKLLHPLLRRAGLNNYTIWSATVAGPILALVFAYVFDTYPGISVGRLFLVLNLGLIVLAAVLAYFEPVAAGIPWSSFRRRPPAPSGHANLVSGLTVTELPGSPAREEPGPFAPTGAEAVDGGGRGYSHNPQAGASAPTGPEALAGGEGGCFADCLEKGFACKERGDWKGALVNFQRGLNQALDVETRLRLMTEVALAKNYLGQGGEAIADLSRELILLSSVPGAWREELSSLIRYIEASRQAAAEQEAGLYLRGGTLSARTGGEDEGNKAAPAVVVAPPGIWPKDKSLS